MTDLYRHQHEILSNRAAWQSKPALRAVYAALYQRIEALLDTGLTQPALEIGSGIGNLEGRFARTITSDVFANPWLDLVCDGYELPFGGASLSHLVLFDVFHHLERPFAFLREARRVLVPDGRLIIMDPYISAASVGVYGVLHHEPIGWLQAIDPALAPPPHPRGYFAAQGNATRLFFGSSPIDGLLDGWELFYRDAFSTFAYFLTGGFSRTAFYPERWSRHLQQLDALLSRWPRLFGGRCLIGLIRR